MSYSTNFTTANTQSMAGAFRQNAQRTKTAGLKGAAGSAMIASRTEDCLFEVDAILRATTPEDAKDRVQKAILYCEQLVPEEGAEKMSHLLISLLAKRRVRGGEGMKKHFFDLFVNLFETQPSLREYLLKVVPYLPHLGCFKDYWQILKAINERELADYHTDQLQLQHFKIFNELVITIVHSFLAQIRKDMKIVQDSIQAAEQTETDIHISLAGKWSVSEKCSFGKGTHWYLPIYQGEHLKGLHKRTLYHYMSIYRWNPEFIRKGIKPKQVPDLVKELPSMMKKMRKTFTLLKEKLDIPEVLMSSKRWADIEHEKVSAICRMKHMDAFKNEKKQKRGPKVERYPYDEDRIQCADNFAEFMGSGKLTQGAMDLISIYQKIHHCTQPQDIKMYEEMLKGVILTTGKDIVKYYVQQQEKANTQAETHTSPSTDQPAKVNPEEFFTAINSLPARTEPDYQEAKAALVAHPVLQTTEELDNFYQFLKKKNYTNTTQIDTVKRVIALFARGVIPVMDVSGSMSVSATKTASCMDICVSLGVLFTFLNPGDYADLAISFTDFPITFDFTNMTYKQRIQKVFQHVGYNTNVQLMMAEYLKIATTNNIPEDQLADIVIFSDGGFDAMIGGTESRWNTATEKFRKMFQQAGYRKMPQIYFSNLAAGQRNFQETPTRRGVSQLNGYNPAMFQQIMTGNTPASKSQQDTHTTQKSTHDDYMGKVTDKFFDLYRMLMTETESGLLAHYQFNPATLPADPSSPPPLTEAEKMLAETNHMLEVQKQRVAESVEGRPASAPPGLELRKPSSPTAPSPTPEEEPEGQAPPVNEASVGGSIWNMMGFSS